MASTTDFIAYGADGRALMIETKVRTGIGNGAGWSTSYRSNLISDAVGLTDAWFLLATPETLFLWKPGQDPDAVATWETDARPIFAPYLAHAGIEPTARLDGQAFEMIVAFWLRDMRLATPAPEEPGLVAVLRERLHEGLVVRGKTAA